MLYASNLKETFIWFQKIVLLRCFLFCSICMKIINSQRKKWICAALLILLWVSIRFEIKRGERLHQTYEEKGPYEFLITEDFTSYDWWSIPTLRISLGIPIVSSRRWWSTWPTHRRLPLYFSRSFSLALPRVKADDHQSAPLLEAWSSTLRSLNARSALRAPTPMKISVFMLFNL